MPTIAAGVVWFPCEDGERNPKDDARMLGRLDKPERYGVNLVVS